MSTQRVREDDASVRGRSISRGSHSQRPLKRNIQEDRISICPLAMVRQDHNLSCSFFYVWSTHTLCVASRRDVINYRRQPFEKTLDIDCEKSLFFFNNSEFKNLEIIWLVNKRKSHARILVKKKFHCSYLRLQFITSISLFLIIAYDISALWDESCRVDSGDPFYFQRNFSDPTFMLLTKRQSL